MSIQLTILLLALLCAASVLVLIFLWHYGEDYLKNKTAKNTAIFWSSSACALIVAYCWVAFFDVLISSIGG